MAQAGIIDSTKVGGVITAGTADVGDLFEQIEAASGVLTLGRNIGSMPKGSMNIPMPLDLITAQFVNGADGEKPVTDASLKVETLQAGKIAAIAVVPQDVLDDADIDLWNDWLKPQVPSAFGVALDAAALFGVGKPTAWTGFQSGLVPQAVEAGATVPITANIYDDIMGEDGLIAKVEESGFSVNGFLGKVSMQATLRSALDANNRPLYQPFLNPISGRAEKTIDGQPFMALQNGAWVDTTNKSLMIGGDFSKLIYSIRKEIEYRISTDATVKLADGRTVNCFQQNLVAFLMEMRIAAAVINPVNRMNQTENRFPFAVLTEAAGG